MCVCVQIQQWEQNLERLNLDLFRLRCYLSSLQGSELPNPKSLLAVASRPSKSTLGRLGVFSVSSFHALVRSAALSLLCCPLCRFALSAERKCVCSQVCSRGEAPTLRRRRQSAESGRRTRGLPTSLKALGGLSRRSRDSRLSDTQVTNQTTALLTFYFLTPAEH